LTAEARRGQSVPSMRVSSFPFASGIALLCTAAQAGSRTADADLKFLQDLTETRSWSLGEPTRVRLTPDGSTVLFLRSLARKPVMRLYAFDVASGQEREIITPEQVLAGKEETLPPEEAARRERMRVTTRGFTSYELSEDGKLVLVTLSGRAFVVPISTGVSREVARPSKKGRAHLRRAPVARRQERVVRAGRRAVGRARRGRSREAAHLRRDAFEDARVQSQDFFAGALCLQARSASTTARWNRSAPPIRRACSSFRWQSL